MLITSLNASISIQQCQINGLAPGPGGLRSLRWGGVGGIFVCIYDYSHKSQSLC